MLVFSRKRKLWLVGLLAGAGAAARLTLAFGISYFMNRSREERTLIRQWFPLLAGFAIPLIAIAAFNYCRFGSPTETGFGKALLYEPFLEQARSVGMFSAAHVPKNIFMMLLKGPELIGGDASPVIAFPYIRPSMWGMGLFFTSPALIYALKPSLSSLRARSLWLGVLTIAIPLMFYYGIGYVQFGYRYALDFVPFLALLAALGMPQPMTNRARALVTVSVLICFWGAVHLAVWL
jgi:hypothetical protein